MAPRLADRLDEGRRRRIVGRTAEINLFLDALAATELPFNLLWLHGPGGVGKTTLVRRFERLAAERVVPAAYLDARYVDPSPDGFLAAVRGTLNPEPDAAPVALDRDGNERNVLIVDTYELLTPLDSWIREIFLPRLSAQTLVVLAGRNAPPAAWRADPGWQNVARVVPLRNFSAEESRDYLTRREIASEQHDAALGFTYGHPLALALVADAFLQRGAFPLEGQQAPDLVRTLVEQFVQKVPGPAHRAALEAAALVRLTTEGLLATLLATPDAHELFEWLRSLSFLESGPQGVFPHDLARNALSADLRWRHPDWFGELHRRARAYYAARLSQARGVEQQRILFDYVYLHRDNPLMRPYLDWQETGATLPDVLREKDHDALRAMVARHEGDQAVRWLDYWIEHQPNGFVIYRDPRGEPAAFLAAISLDELDTVRGSDDPAIAIAWQYLQRRAPLRPGEKATYFRFWMARETYQSVSPLQSLLFGRAAQHYLTTPRLAFSFFATSDPDFWAPMFAHVDLPRLTEVDAVVGDRRYGVFVHDWRVTSPLAWLELLGERELAADTTALAPPTSVVPLVLSQSDFAAATRDALRDLTRTDSLRQNPLLRSRVVLDRAGAQAKLSARVKALQDALRDAVSSLGDSPRDRKLQRALTATYLNPVATQELAAELLDLPFSTYRRHLAAGIARVVDLLWSQELGQTDG